MVLEEQLRELLDKLDLTCSMKSSGSRSKRAKLLKKEIALLRTKLSQQHSPPPPAESGTGGLEEDGARPGPQAGEEGKPAPGAGPGASSARCWEALGAEEGQAVPPAWASVPWRVPGPEGDVLPCPRQLLGEWLSSGRLA